MSAEYPSGVLESIILRNGPNSVAAFMHGSSVMRTALGACKGEDTLTLAPLRGAMPIVWSVEGLSSVEASSGAEFVELPIGIHQRMTARGLQETSPNEQDKAKIIRTRLLNVMEADKRTTRDTRLAIIDEVQRGGTLGAATKATRAIISKFGFHPVLRVFAAQDCRRKVSAQPKTSQYEALASNSTPSTLTTVVPMPLVATDRPSLLDTVTLKPYNGFGEDLSDHLIVTRNKSSEAIFRTLGSFARIGEVRHDQAFMDSFVDANPMESVRASYRVEDWMRNLVSILDGLSVEQTSL